MCDCECSPQYIALAQLCSALKRESIKEKRLLLDRLVKKGLDVDYAIPLDSPVAQHSPELVGWTALHFAIKAQDREIISYIIQHGARVTAVSNAFSPIRLAVECLWNSLRRKGITKHPVVESLLEAQYNQSDASNPSCKLGLSHLHIACIVDDARMVKFLLRSGASVDATISADSPYLAGFRPVHVAVRYCASNSLELLLEHGADLWAREARGLTPLQLAIEYNLELADAMSSVDCKCRDNLSPLSKHNLAYERMTKLILGRCAVRSLRDECGLEQLHVAASMRDNAMLDDVLKANSEVEVNAAISANSPLWPGYTPLHFAARSGVDAIKVLIRRGANLAVADARGITPFDLCLNRYGPTILSEIMSLDETLKSVTLKTSCHATLCDAVKALQSTDRLKAFLRKMDNVNDPVSLDSPLWPGCTLLHLAVALMCPQNNESYLDKLSEEFNVDVPRTEISYAVLMHLLENGANPLAQDVRNFSPVHLAFRQGKPMALRLLIHQLVRTSQMLDNATDLDGLSLLHIGSVLGHHDQVDALLLNGADVNARTKSELRFWWKSEHRKLQEFHFNAGSTPLHFAVACNSQLIEFLIEKGADPLATDADGLTPLLLTFIARPDYFTRPHVKKLLSTSPSLSKSDAVSIEGLSHFHLACWSNSVTAVRSFLGQVDINSKINCGLNDTYAECPRALKSIEYYTSSQGEKESLLLTAYAGYTPLHIAVEYESLEVIELLVEWGADVHARNARGMSPLHMALVSNSAKADMVLDSLMTRVNYLRVNIPKCGPVDNCGFTALHIACRKLDVEWVKRLLTEGSDVNAQIALHSPVWPGDTPLHVLINGRLENLISMTDTRDILAIAKLLIPHGADVALPNADNVTPLHAITDLSGRKLNLPIVFLENNKLKNYNVNQMNVEGLSFIHIACLANNVELVSELCTRGADINRPIDYFAEGMGGCGPLHFAAMVNNPKLVQFLIKKGAKVSAEDCRGCTPLHSFCEYSVNSKENLVPTLCEHGADVNDQDIYGRTPLQILLQSPFEQNRVISLMNRGARLNAINPLSGESILTSALSERKRYLPDILPDASDADILSVLDDGSTAVHNVVRGYVKESCASAEYYSSVIEELLKRGCSINARDNRGRTALHVAVEYRNYMGVCSLLATGINANIADYDGQVALSLNWRHQKIHLGLLMYLHKLILLGLEVSEPNHRLYETTQGFPPNEANYLEKKLREEITALRGLKLYGSFSLREVMTDRALKEYTTMPLACRRAIVERLALPELYEQFPTLRSPIRYQYRRLLERVDLVKPAKYVLAIITGNVVPELCLDKIISFLNNEELKTLIAVRIEKENLQRNISQS